MKSYTQLNLDEREKLFLNLRLGINKTDIAKKLGRHRSTIYREVSRNKDPGYLGYLPDRAHIKTKERKAKQEKKFERNCCLKKHTIEKLKEGWSPEMIAGRLKLEKSDFCVSHETIYSFVYNREGHELGLYKYLVKGRPKRKTFKGRKPRKPLIKERVSIHDRPANIAARDEFGHLEGDLTFFKGSLSQNVAVLLERKSRFMIMIKNESKKSDEVMKAMFNRLASLPASARRSVTFDNGSEFAKHTLLKHSLKMDTFFCDPHSPWQKGQVENANAFMHRYIPKSTHPSLIDFNQLMLVQNKLNNLPRKCLGFKTPAEVLKEEIS